MQQSVEEKQAYNSIITKTSYLSNTLFLLTHISYLIFFLIIGKYVMVYTNIISVSIYLAFYIVIRLKKYNFYAIGSGLEIVAFMNVGTFICGFQAGFHLCILGLCILAFFTAYFSRKTNSKLLFPLIWTSLSLVDFLILFFYSRFNEPYYDLPTYITSALYTVHSIIVFSFVGGFLYIFTRYARRLEGKIKKESRTDKLTKISNRYALFDYLYSLDNKDNYILTIFDIDDFKHVNDQYGHLCGDKILVDIANIASNTNGIEFVSRYGGEEFIVISKMTTNLDDAIIIIDNIRKAVAEYNFKFENLNIHVTITMGVSKFEEGMSIDKWIKDADNKLYIGKNNGKNKTQS